MNSDEEVKKYEEWKKTKKQFYITYDQIESENGHVKIIGRVDRSIKIGDILGCAKVLKIEAYGKELDESGDGLGCRITFDKMPYLVIDETYLGFANT